MGTYQTYYRTVTVIKGQSNVVNLNDLYQDIAVDYAIRMTNLVVGTTVYSHLDMPYWFTINDSPATDYPYPWSQWGTSTGSEYDNYYTIVPQSNQSFAIQLLVEEKIDYDSGVFPPFTQRVYSQIKFIVLEAPSTTTDVNAYGYYDRVIRVEKNAQTNKSFGTDGLYPNGEQIAIDSTLPAWITNNTIDGFTQTWDILAPTVNTYNYYGDVYLKNEDRVNEYKGRAIITLIVVESLFEEIDNCCSNDNINIVWLNRQGGRGNYIFTQRKNFNVEIGDKKTYITKDIKRYSEINKVYNGTTVYATGLSLNQIDFLDTLRYSIQAWVFVNETFIPILLDVGSFEKYNTKENMYEISLSFIYAEQLNIQRQ